MALRSARRLDAGSLVKEERKDELRELGRDAAGEVTNAATTTLVNRFVDWIRELVQRGRARRAKRRE